MHIKKLTILIIFKYIICVSKYIHIVVKQISRTFSFCTIETISISSHFPPFPPLVTTFLLSISINLITLYT